MARCITEITDRDIKILIRMRCQNDKFTPKATITSMKIVDKCIYISEGLLGFRVTVFTKQYQPENYSINLMGKVYANEVLLLQELGYNLSVLETKIIR